MDRNYYLGLDIGTDSVGYAVTDEYYNIPKFRGEPVIGVQTFDAAMTSAERRAFRTSRRTLDRRQQRVRLVNEIFALDIGKKDPRFFIRRMESYLYREEAGDESVLFNDPNYSDKDYYQDYPTIHHLINELMNSKEPHDIRLVYLACSWLVAHRGHFLFNIDSEDLESILSFERVYEDLRSYLKEECGCGLPWNDSVTAEQIKEILTMKTGISRKTEAFKKNIYDGKKIEKEPTEDFPFSRESIVKLLCGSSLKPEDIFRTGEYMELESVSLEKPDEDFERIISDLGEARELLRKLRAMYDCALLNNAQNGKKTLSEAKIVVYEQHRSDLENLKAFVKKYIPEEYGNIFKKAVADNYVAYSYNVSSCKEKQSVKKTTQENFCAFLKKKVAKIAVQDADHAFYEDMLNRLENGTFLPKQKTSDNRVIPQQLYRYELEKILDNAETYLPMLRRKDETGLTNKEKILSIFDFRIPYYVGPLNKYKNKAWVVREEGKIYPWNFAEKVDLDESENEFIRRMTNTCTYLAGEEVLPEKSLLYGKYTVLNEINNLKINGNPIPVEIKQRIFVEVFRKYPAVKLKNITEFLKTNGLLFESDTLSGMDIKINSSLYSYHKFRKLLESKTLSENDVENIIKRAAYSEDKVRLNKWISENYPQISDTDRKYIVGLNLKGFGRLSRRFLTEIYSSFAEDISGEAFSVMDLLWNTNDNLMQILSQKYNFCRTIEELNKEYYSGHHRNLSDRLDDMYISNSVKRPIFRTLDICSDVVKAMGHAPEKIFIEMARDHTGADKGKRTSTRKQQLLALYKEIKTAEAREFAAELESMGEEADNKLQSEKLFLYYLQMGKSAYTGKPIDLSRLNDSTYNREHIYPRAFVKDDSILNNLVLVESEINGEKSNSFPIKREIQEKMRPMWESWLRCSLITQEKFNRLTRMNGFSEEEKWNFINRQLVETRQSTKAIAELLKEKYPSSEIVYVKAGLVSEFRQEFDLLKSRAVNDLHHAKDAYLNIVVGNVYNSKFTKQFNVNSDYSIKVEKIFKHPVKCGKTVVWQGQEDLAKIRAVMGKNAIHMTKYCFCRKGGLYDQQIRKAEEGLVPVKAGRDTSKYGGYRKPAASFFSLVKYTTNKKTDIMFMPVELEYAGRYLKDSEFAAEYAKKTIAGIWNQPVDKVEFLYDRRPIKINTMISLDGLKMVINGKSGGGKQLIVSLATPLILSASQETYVKHLEAYQNKTIINPKIAVNEKYDGINAKDNMDLYDTLLNKMRSGIYLLCPGNQSKTLESGKEKFGTLKLEEQVQLLLNIIIWFSSSSATVDLSLIGGAKRSGAKYPTSSLSSWAKTYKDVRIIDVSSSGLYDNSNISCNILKML